MTRFLLPLTALIAFARTAARAALQAITRDEADSYLAFVDHFQPAHWYASSNNHILNSALMRLSTGLFDVSPFTVRLPALLGAALFLYAAYRLCRALSDQWYVQWPLFACLAFNPFTADFLAAARGYGMALAFLLLAILPLVPSTNPPSLQAVARSSALLALAFTANFSFALIAISLLVALALAAYRTHTKLRALAATLLPAAAVIYAGPLWTLRRFPRSELWWGAATLNESLQSLYDATLYRLNPHLANRVMLDLFTTLKPALLPAVALTAVACAVYLRMNRSDQTKLWSECRPRFAATLVLAAAAALAVHQIAHAVTGLMLPKERTGLYLPVLLTLAAGAIAAVPPFSRTSRVLRGALLTSLYALSIYFLLCMRLDHFKEWFWDADADKIYSEVACLNHEHGVREVTSVWMYQSVLNFYRVASGQESLEPVVAPDADRPGTQVYVINKLFDANLVGDKSLRIIYAAPSTDALIAVKPELFQAIQSGPCVH